jgi:hypothetical protein
VFNPLRSEADAFRVVVAVVVVAASVLVLTVAIRAII